jgi:hypothetical protein
MFDAINISKHFSSRKKIWLITHHEYFITQVPANEYNITVRLFYSIGAH